MIKVRIFYLKQNDKCPEKAGRFLTSLEITKDIKGKVVGRTGCQGQTNGWGCPG